MKKGIIYLAAILLGTATLPAAVVVTFDPPQLPHGGIGLNAYSENGVIFTGTSLGSFVQTDTGNSGRPDNGTAHLDILQYGTQFAFQNGGLFRLSQIDLAEYSTVFATPQTIQLIGYKPDNSTVGFSFTTDGIIDGTGPLADFQTVTLPATFTGLQRVAFNAATFSIDNVTVTAVPEPSTLLGVTLAAGLLLLRLRRRTA